MYDFHLELTAKEWANLQAVRGGMPFGGQKKQLEKPGAAPLVYHKGASAEFPWAHAEFTAIAEHGFNLQRSAYYRGDDEADAWKRTVDVHLVTTL